MTFLSNSYWDGFFGGVLIAAVVAFIGLQAHRMKRRPSA
jgi:hypothetical protein